MPAKAGGTLARCAATWRICRVASQNLTSSEASTAAEKARDRTAGFMGCKCRLSGRRLRRAVVGISPAAGAGTPLAGAAMPGRMQEPGLTPCYGSATPDILGSNSPDYHAWGG